MTRELELHHIHPWRPLPPSPLHRKKSTSRGEVHSGLEETMKNFLAQQQAWNDEIGEVRLTLNKKATLTVLPLWLEPVKIIAESIPETPKMEDFPQFREQEVRNYW